MLLAAFFFHHHFTLFTTIGHTGSRFHLGYNVSHSDSTARGCNWNNHPNILGSRRHGRTGCRTGAGVYRHGSGHARTSGCNRSVPRLFLHRSGISTCHTGQVPAVPPTGSANCRTVPALRCKNRTPAVHGGSLGIVHVPRPVRQNNPSGQSTGDCCFAAAAAAVQMMMPPNQHP